jgi:hypothetical protein
MLLTLHTTEDCDSPGRDAVLLGTFNLHKRLLINNLLSSSDEILFPVLKMGVECSVDTLVPFIRTSRHVSFGTPQSV